MKHFGFYLRVIIVGLVIIWIIISITKIIQEAYMTSSQVEILRVKHGSYQYRIYTDSAETCPILELRTTRSASGLDIYVIEAYALETITSEDLEVAILLGPLEGRNTIFKLDSLQLSEPSTLFIYNSKRSKTVDILTFKLWKISNYKIKSSFFLIFKN